MISLNSIGMLIGGVGLFLMGMTLMTDGLKVAAGRTLKQLLERWTDSSVHGLLSGALLTALVQSSSAVTVAAIGFVNAGMLTLERSVWVIFGSNIGTTMTGWLVALIGLKVNVALFAYPAIGIGMFLKITGMESRRGALGQAVAGFGLIFVGITVLKDAFTGVADTINVTGLYSEGLLGVVTFVTIGFVMTLLTQASAAAISIALTAAAGNLIGLEPAAALVIGANIGTTSTALLASIGATPNAKRVAASHVVFNLLTGAVAILIMPLMLATVAGIESAMKLSPDVATSLALFHTVFNVLGVALIWPLTSRLVKWLQTRFVSIEEDLGRPRFLDKNALVVPSLALESLMLELARLQEIAVSIVVTALDPVPANRQELRQRLNVVETLSLRIGDYARSMYQAQLPPSVSDALMHPYRALQHFEEIARIGASLPQRRAERPALDAHTEHLLDAYLETVRHELKLMTHPEPLPEDWSPKHAREVIREAYGQLKVALLSAGSRGDLPYQQLDDTVNFIDHVHTCGVRAIKAERRLRQIRAAAQGIESPEGEQQNTDDA
ncbi:MAG TPA: Na/Pi symporter [Magnetovibrio sp.]